MKPLTETELQSILDSDLIWRRREITSLVTAMQTADLAAKEALIRAAIPLLYAHWEGFGRSCFQRYVEHVSFKNLRFKDLHPAFSYLNNAARIQEMGRTSIKAATSMLPALLQSGNSVNRNPFRKSIDTKSNLRFDVLEGLCALCGIDASPYEEFKDFINHEICDPRNEIAHGHSAAPPLSLFIRRRDKVFAIMAQLQTSIVNAAVNRDYKA